MQTLVCTQPGQLAYLPGEKPVVSPGRAILRIRRIGICGTDLHAFEGTQPFFNYPRILGHELAAEFVEADGDTDFVPGEAVTFLPYFSCGHCVACRMGKTNCCTQLQVSGVHIDGGMVEYLSVPTETLVHGNGLSFDELALVEPLSIGAHSIRRAAIQPGEWVLVIGAGPIGLGVMEFARIAGGRVIALDINPTRLSFCQRRLKVEHALLASDPDLMAQLAAITNDEMPTVVIDATGNRNAINNAFQYMSHGGRYLLVGLQRDTVVLSHPEFHKREGTLMSSRNATRVDFEHVMNAMRQGWVDPTTYITHRVAFGQVRDEFASWLDPANGVIKAMVELS